MFARRLRWTDVVRRRKLMARQVTATVILVSMSAMVALGMMAQPEWVTPATTLFIVLLGVFGLKLPGMIGLGVAVLAQVIGLEASGLAEFEPGALLVLAAGVLAALLFVRSRDRLGLQGAASDLMLVDLRDRLVAQVASRRCPRPGGSTAWCGRPPRR